MKKVGFIGAYDKSDLILYIAKIITYMGKKVIVIDGTTTQKTKYTVPAISNSKSYLTSFEEFDVAVGFRSYEEMLEDLQIGENNYDIALIDVDSADRFDRFSLEEADINYFVTSFDLYALKKGLEILSNMEEGVKLTKILFSRYMSKAEDEYFNFLSENYNINWDKEKISFPMEQGDKSAIIENQRASKLKTKNLSAQYRDSLLAIVGHITENEDFITLRKMLKKMDKGV